MTEALWIREAEVVELIALPDAIEAVDAGYRAEATGSVSGMLKTHAKWAGHNTLHALGGVSADWGIVGTKTWAHTSGGACPLLILFNAETGALEAIIEAFALGQMRTASATGVATRVMSSHHSRHLAQIGTGKQSLAQVAAVLAVRPIDLVTVYSPTKENREAFADRVQEQLGVNAAAVGSIAEATKGADIVTTATRATSPFLGLADLESNAHVNAIGAITPERMELQADVVEGASRRAADNVEVALRLSPEYGQFKDRMAENWIEPLSAVLEADEGWRRPGISVFKAMGTGLADLSVGRLVLERAREAGVGRKLDQPERASPRLRSSK